MDENQFRKIKSPIGYITVEPKPTFEFLSNFYKEQYHQKQLSNQQNNYDNEEISYRNLHADLIIHALAKAQAKTSLSTPQMSLLDVGCGEGFLLARALEKGWNIQGIDFSDFAIKKFKPHIADYVNFGDAYTILAEKCAANEMFDCCVMQNVLEHVANPTNILQSIRKIINPNGVIMIIIPNDYSPLQIKALEIGIIDKEIWWSPPEHLNYFNIQNGISFVESLGFTVKDVFSTFPVDLFLFHPESNYYQNRERGADAHRARIRIELLMAEAGIEKYYTFCHALAGCEIGRNFALILGV